MLQACWNLSSLKNNWYFSAFQTPTSLCFRLSVSLSVRLRGNRGPLLTHLSRSHTDIHFLSLSVYHSCSSIPSIHLPAFLPTVSGVFEARAAAVASGVIQCNRMTSITQAQACWTSHRLPDTTHTFPAFSLHQNL